MKGQDPLNTSAKVSVVVDKLYSPKQEIVTINGKLIFRDIKDQEPESAKFKDKDKEISLLSSKIQNDIHVELEGRNKSLPGEKRASKLNNASLTKSPQYAKSPKLAGYESKILKQISTYYQAKLHDNLYSAKPTD